MKSKISDLVLKNFSILITQQKLEGGILTNEQAQSLQNEIESHYIDSGINIFGARNNDIRKKLFNFFDPYLYIKFKEFSIRVTDGLVEGEPYSGNRRKTHLIYADSQIIAKFYTLADARLAVREIDLFINKNNMKSDKLRI
jgi:hypothetical protein